MSLWRMLTETWGSSPSLYGLWLPHHWLLPLFVGFVPSENTVSNVEIFVGTSAHVSHLLASPISTSKSCNSELVSEKRVMRSYFHGWEDISYESLVKQEENVSHEGNKILGAFWVKKELSEPNFRHRVWCGRVLRWAEMIYSLQGWGSWCIFWKELTGWTREWVHLAAKDADVWGVGKSLGHWPMVWRSGFERRQVQVSWWQALAVIYEY